MCPSGLYVHKSYDKFNVHYQTEQSHGVQVTEVANTNKQLYKSTNKQKIGDSKKCAGWDIMKDHNFFHIDTYT